MKKSLRSKELETILVLVLASGVLYWVNKKTYLLAVSLIIGFTGLLVPIAAKAIHFVWMKLAEVMGFIMSKIVLTIIFVIIVIPLGWISRKAGKLSINLKLLDKTYYKERNHTYTGEDMENLW